MVTRLVTAGARHESRGSLGRLGAHTVEKVARGYSWEPFKPNNTAALKHGARSERMITPLAAQIANDLRENNRHLQNPQFEEMVLEYTRVAAQVDLLQAYVDRVGMYDRKGSIRNAQEFLLKQRKHEASLMTKLAMTPLDEAQLNRDNALSELDLSAVDAWIDQLTGGSDGTPPGADTAGD